jgi:hypothetical protein
MKYDADKPAIALVPPEFIEEVAKVFGMGAKKYGLWNWRKDALTTAHSRTYSSVQRHLNAYWKGENIDPESGLPHLAHAASQIAILMIHQLDAPQMDDRYIPAKEAKNKRTK